MVTFGRKVARKSGNLLRFIHHGVSSETIELETTAKVGENADVFAKNRNVFHGCPENLEKKRLISY